MKPIRKITLALALLALGASVTAPANAGGRQTPQDDPFEKLKAYDFQSRTAVQAIYTMIQQAADKPQKAQIEQHLITVLDDPSATFAGKQEACRMLWIIGSANSVPSLTKMLTDEKLSDIARYALERNVDPAAGKALRAALKTTSGRTQLGIINSVGDRGDTEAVASLKPFTTSADSHVSEAAIAALGKIGTDNALAILRSLPASNPLVGHAMLRCTEHFAAMGKKAEAQKEYEALAGEKYPPVVRVEALRGLASIAAPHTASVILTALKSTDPYVQQAAARIGGSLSDPQAAAHVIAAGPTLPPAAQAILLTSLADRREVAALPFALSAAKSQDAGLRETAIMAAARIGGPQAVAHLVDIALHGMGQDRNTAREGLASISGADADQAILKLARQGQPDARALLMGVLVERPAPTMIPLLLEAAHDSNTTVAVSAVRALGRAGSDAESGVLIKTLVETKSDEIRDAAKDSIVAIAHRSGDNNRALGPILMALPDASPPGRAALMPVLAELGGDRAFAALAKSTAGPEPEVRQAAITALADTWSDSRALPTLLNIAKSDPKKSLRVQAMRGYIRLIGQDERMPADQKVQNLAAGLAVSERPEEKRQALGILRDCRVSEAMDAAAKLLDTPDLFAEASDTVLYLAAPQKNRNRDLAAVKGAATNAALDKIIALTKDDAQRAKAQQLKS